MDKLGFKVTRKTLHPTNKHTNNVHKENNKELNGIQNTKSSMDQQMLKCVGSASQ